LKSAYSHRWRLDKLTSPSYTVPPRQTAHTRLKLQLVCTPRRACYFFDLLASNFRCLVGEIQRPLGATRSPYCRAAATLPTSGHIPLKITALIWESSEVRGGNRGCIGCTWPYNACLSSLTLVVFDRKLCPWYL
jgi:hypothetical protein